MVAALETELGDASKTGSGWGELQPPDPRRLSVQTAVHGGQSGKSRSSRAVECVGKPQVYPSLAGVL